MFRNAIRYVTPLMILLGLVGCTGHVDQTAPASFEVVALDGQPASVAVLDAARTDEFAHFSLGLEDGVFELDVAEVDGAVHAEVREGDVTLGQLLFTDGRAFLQGSHGNVASRGLPSVLDDGDAALFHRAVLVAFSVDTLRALGESGTDQGEVVAHTEALAIGGGGGLSAMCCETYDPSTDQGTDCAFLGPGRTCQGDIMTCPGQCEYIDRNGNGICKPCADRITPGAVIVRPIGVVRR